MGRICMRVVVVVALVASVTVSTVSQAGSSTDGSISGTVTDACGGLRAYTAMAVLDEWGNAPSGVNGFTDTSGQYTISGLGPGSYVVFFSDSQAVLPSQWYSQTLDPADATLVTVPDGGAVTGIDASITTGCVNPSTLGGLSGTVTTVDGTAIPNITVTANGPTNLTASTDSSGVYSFTGVPPGDYHVQFTDPSATYQSVWYDNQASEASATAVTIVAGEQATADTQLAAIPGTLSGTVQGVNGEPVENFSVGACVYPQSPTPDCFAGLTSTDASGHYSLTLAPGNYIVASTGPGSVRSDDITVTVTKDQTTTQDITIPFGTISGTVLNGNGQPFTTGTTGLDACPTSRVPGVICAGSVSAFTDVSGHYVLRLAPGSYNVAGFNFRSFTSFTLTPFVPVTLSAGQTLHCDATVPTSVCGVTAFGPAPTPSGTNIAVQPGDTATNTTPVSITFASVSAAGTTSLTSSTTGPATPLGFQLGTPPMFYDITTTATFTGPITTCFDYDASTYPSGAGLALLHYDTSTNAWQDVTTSLNTLSHRICGATTSLSPFIVAARKYHFAGFFSPIDKTPVRNTTKAGKAIPVKFALGGNQGLTIMGTGSPTSRHVNCDTTAQVDEIETTVTAGNSTLIYDAASDTYTYTWKTSTDWAGTCRELAVTLADLSTHTAIFQFR